MFKVLPVFFCFFGLLRLSAQAVHELKFSTEIAAELDSGTLYPASAACHYSYIGEYERALQTYDFPLVWGLDTLTEEDRINFRNYRPVSIFSYLPEKLAQTRLVIISEAHHKPQHRVFVRRLLPLLKEQGFDCLGLETLTPSLGDTSLFLMDADLHRRGYPLNSPVTGFYTREPQMGNLVRDALQLEFELFAYERTNKGVERDLQQARNILRYMSAHPDRKVVILCGGYHAVESAFPKRRNDRYLAWHLKRLSGLDPLTIYQDALTERKAAPESPFYPLIEAEEISVMINSAGAPFTGFDTVAHFDFLVYHPPSSWKNGRPNWLYQLENHRLVEIPTLPVEATQYPVIVEAFIEPEPPGGVPLDRIELHHPEEGKALVLPPGSYRLRVLNRNKKAFFLPLLVEP